MIKKRSILLAAFLSFIVPGLGQLYNTQLKLAIFYFLIGCVGTSIILGFSLFKTIEGILLFCFVFLVVIVGIIHSAISAYRNSPVELQKYNKKRIYMLVIIIGTSLSYFSSGDIYENPVHFNVPSLSMAPTLVVGETFIINSSAPDYDYGDIVVFKLPSNSSIDYVKRIVGKSGDKIQYIRGQLYVNERIIPRTFVAVKKLELTPGAEKTVNIYSEEMPNSRIFQIYEMDNKAPLDNTPLYEVPEGHVFVLGDNRDNSMDSRVESIVGFVPLENIRGKADFVFLSSDFGRIGYKLN